MIVETLKAFLSSNDFMPHGYCYMWNTKLVWLHVISDSLIALAYLSIPITLVYFIRKRRDVPFNWVFVCFGVFILACGGTHLMEVWTLWNANYWLSGALKAVTAVASVSTAILLVRLIPRALALPSPEALRREIVERKRAQEALQNAKQDLELRVQERTAELTNANQILLAEIAQRKQTEEELRRSEERFRLLVESVQDYAIFMLNPAGAVEFLTKPFRDQDLVDAIQHGIEKHSSARQERVKIKEFQVLYDSLTPRECEVFRLVATGLLNKQIAADDDPWVGKSLERLIKAGGYRTETLASAEDFVKAGDHHETACLILDLRLPGMSGLELQHLLLTGHYRFPIVFVSAHDEPEARYEAMQAGAIAFFGKPFHDEALLDAVRSVVK
jgi:FixJ family two-component response regulator